MAFWATAIPAIASIAGGALSFLGDKENAEAASDANELNALIAEKNFGLSQDQFNFARKLINQQIAEAKLGSTDAYGNTVKFVEGVGWVTTPSDETQRILDLYNREIERQGTRGAYRSEQDALSDFADRTAAGTTADALLREFEGIRRENPVDVGRDLAIADEQARSSSADAIGEALSRAQLRAGAGNVGMMGSMSARAKADSDAAAARAVNTRIQGRALADQRFDAERAGVGNLYNMFAARAAGEGSPSVTGPTISAQPGSTAGAAQMGAYLTAPQQDYTGNPISTTGAALGGLGTAISAFGADQASKVRYDDFMDYLRTGGTGTTGGSSGDTNTQGGSSFGSAIMDWFK